VGAAPFFIGVLTEMAEPPGVQLAPPPCLLLAGGSLDAPPKSRLIEANSSSSRALPSFFAVSLCAAWAWLLGTRPPSLEGESWMPLLAKTVPEAAAGFESMEAAVGGCPLFSSKVGVGTAGAVGTAAADADGAAIELTVVAGLVEA